MSKVSSLVPCLCCLWACDQEEFIGREYVEEEAAHPMAAGRQREEGKGAPALPLMVSPNYQLCSVVSRFLKTPESPSSCITGVQAFNKPNQYVQDFLRSTLKSGSLMQVFAHAQAHTCMHTGTRAHTHRDSLLFVSFSRASLNKIPQTLRFVH